jgi:hypothetical protein
MTFVGCFCSRVTRISTITVPSPDCLVLSTPPPPPPRLQAEEFVSIRIQAAGASLLKRVYSVSFLYDARHLYAESAY